MSDLQVKWDQIIKLSDLECKPICRWIDLCNGTMFRISAFFTHRYQNMPREGLFVGIERVGAFLFALNNPVNHHYVSQKLYIPESDARAIADWINAQLGFDHPQQGHYDRDMLNDIDYIVYSGERPMLPLIPTIIDKEYHEQSKTDGQGIEGCSVSDRSPSI